MLLRGRATNLKHCAFICFATIYVVHKTIVIRACAHEKFVVFQYVSQEWRDTVMVTTPAQMLSVPLVALLTILSQDALHGLR